jgi:hypothetical protein
MKHLLIISLTVFLIPNLIAQTVTKESALQKLADNVCDCLDSELEFLSADVRQVFIEIKDLSEPEIDDYFEEMATSNPDLINEVITGSLAMSSEDVSANISNCVEGIQGELTKEEAEILGFGKEEDGTLDVLMQDVLLKMNSEDCAFGYAVLEMGLREE